MTKIQEKFNTENVLGRSRSNNLSTNDEIIILFHHLMNKHQFSYGDENQKRLARNWAKEILV